VDANHRAIREGLEAAGCSVVSLASVGRGCPDLLVGYRGHNYLLEVKSGASRHTDEAQARFRESWRGQQAVVGGVAEALYCVGLIEKAYFHRAFLPEVVVARRSPRRAKAKRSSEAE
jgi:hypothetical protein